LEWGGEVGAGAGLGLGLGFGFRAWARARTRTSVRDRVKARAGAGFECSDAHRDAVQQHPLAGGRHVSVLALHERMVGARVRRRPAP